MRRALAICFAILMCSAGLWAHHSYGMFYATDQRVILKGQVTKVSFQEPHVMLTIETKNSGTWQAEWTSPNTLKTQGVAQDAIKTGDFLEIEGSPARDATWRVVSALDEIKRPSDGWLWVRAETGPRTID